MTGKQDKPTAELSRRPVEDDISPQRIARPLIELDERDDSESIDAPLDQQTDDQPEPSKDVLERRSMRKDIEHREKYANRLFWFVAVWVGLMLVIVLLEGSKWASFDLSDTVLTTLIGATTANVLGLFAIVANYLFPKR